MIALASLNRWTAAAIHLGISALIAITVVAVMLALWYPQPYFDAMGGTGLLKILVGVDVAIGPLLTLIIFDRRKKSLRFDLSVIAFLQIAALVYGVYIMRPWNQPSARCATSASAAAARAPASS